ncbi:MAG: hypothetical protein HY270_21815 [Deltaproteobacteria bacterium]|nr:hypothetical protein [Deltaproteobacteria bacterium]
MSRFAFLLVVLSVAVAGCSLNLGRPTESPTGDQAPVNLRSLQIQNVDGHRAVLLRLSRLPTLVRHSYAGKPGRISVEAWGPTGASDLPERSLDQTDDEISGVRVSRSQGALRIILDFRADNPPQYTVHEMADWIMVRLGTPNS